MYKIIGADQKEYGPITMDQMRQWIAEGRVNSQTLVWSEASGNWKPLSTFPEFTGAFPNVAPGAAAQPQYGAPRTNPMALWGMISGIIAIPLTCCCYGIPFNIVAIILSAIGLSQIKNDPSQGGRGMALTGLILGVISVLLAVIFVVLGVAFQDDITKWVEQYK